MDNTTTKEYSNQQSAITTIVTMPITEVMVLSALKRVRVTLDIHILPHFHSEQSQTTQNDKLGNNTETAKNTLSAQPRHFHTLTTN